LKKNLTVGSNFYITGSVLFFITLGTKLLALLREMLMAAYIGMNFSTDAYNIVAIAISLITGIAGVAISSSLIPILASISSEMGEDEKDKYFSNVFLILMLLGFIFAMILNILSEQIIRILAPGFSETTIELAVRLFKIGFIKVNVIIAATLFTQYLNYKHSFYSPMIASSIGTFLIILYFIIVGKSADVATLMILTVITYIVQVIWMIPALGRKGFRFWFYFKLNNPLIYKFFSLSFPAIVSHVSKQIGTVTNRSIASFLTVGTISALGYANSIVMMVNMTVSHSIATVIYPRLAITLGEGSDESAVIIFRQGLLLVSILLLPTVVGLFYLAKPIVAILFERGIFTAENSTLTAKALGGYSIGIFGYAVLELTNRFFYSLKDTKTPMLATFVGVIVTIILSIILFKPFGVAGLSLSISMMYIVSSSMLLMFIHLKGFKLFNKGTLFDFMRIIFATIVMGIVLISLNQANQFSISNGILKLGLKILISAIIYFLMLIILFRKNRVKRILFTR